MEHTKKNFEDLSPGDSIWFWDGTPDGIVEDKVSLIDCHLVKLGDCLVWTEGNTVRHLLPKSKDHFITPYGNFVATSMEPLIQHVRGKVYKVLEELVVPRESWDNLRVGDVVFSKNFIVHDPTAFPVDILWIREVDTSGSIIEVDHIDHIHNFSLVSRTDNLILASEIPEDTALRLVKSILCEYSEILM